MSRRVVLFHEGDSLYLSEVQPAEGPPTSGFVENGCWYWELKEGEELAKDEQWVVNRWPARALTSVEVPRHVRGHYSDVIDWALLQLSWPREPRETGAF